MNETIEINGETYVKQDQPDPSDYVLIRSKDSGVHLGKLRARQGSEVHLEDARRIWRWRGANTLNEVATEGIESAEESGYTRVSKPVSTITVLGVCEVLPVTKEAMESIVNAGWAK